LSGFPCTALPDPLAGFIRTYLYREDREGRNMGRGRNGRKEGKRSGPFPTSSAVTVGRDNKLNENHRLDSDLSTYNKLGGITLCITEMATH